MDDLDLIEQNKDGKALYRVLLNLIENEYWKEVFLCLKKYLNVETTFEDFVLEKEIVFKTDIDIHGNFLKKIKLSKKDSKDIINKILTFFHSLDNCSNVYQLEGWLGIFYGFLCISLKGEELKQYQNSFRYLVSYGFDWATREQIYEDSIEIKYPHKEEEEEIPSEF